VQSGCPLLPIKSISPVARERPPMQKTIVLISDMTELADDLERIKDGKLSTPTVSAVKVRIGEAVEEVVIFLGE
jgi:hypothetical protein